MATEVQRNFITCPRLISSRLAAVSSTGKASPKPRRAQNGSLEKYENDDEFSIQLKEAISKTTDEELKQELILEYAKYNNIKPETLKC